MRTWESYEQTMVVPSSLWAAAKENDVPTIRALLGEGRDINARDHRGYSPLMLAAYAGNVEAFDCLMACGADPNSTDHAGNSVLMGAAFKGYLTLMKKLLEAGADPSVKNLAGVDARELALMFGRVDVVELINSIA